MPPEVTITAREVHDYFDYRLIVWFLSHPSVTVDEQATKAWNQIKLFFVYMQARVHERELLSQSLAEISN